MYNFFQFEASYECLDPRYVFLLDAGKKIFIWNGKKSKNTVQSKARYAVILLCAVYNFVTQKRFMKTKVSRYIDSNFYDILKINVLH